MERILVIDDDPGFRELLDAILSEEGYEVESGASVADALRLGAGRQYNLVLTDLKLPDGTGIDVLRWFSEQAPNTPVIMITAFGTVESAVEAMKLGAEDYLGKPLNSPDELRLTVRRALEQRRTKREHALLREEQARRFDCRGMIAGDPKMTALLELARKVAPTNATVLMTGESGTGKEVIARCIHENSARNQRVFVPVNCAALSPTLIESELFGHEKGAFTGAVGQHLGRFRARARRHAVPGRNRRTGRQPPGEAAARAAGEVLRARGRHQADLGGRARDRGHQPESEEPGCRRQVPRGSLLPAEPLPARNSAAARPCFRYRTAGGATSCAGRPRNLARPRRC